jgi:virginiamycin B lyase
VGLSSNRINGVLAIGLCAVMVAGCSSGGASIGTSAMRPQSQSPVLTALSKKAAKGNVTFTIGIKPKQKTGRITPKYLSPSTQSLKILTDGANPVIVNLAPSSPNCSPNPTLPGAYICRASLSVPTGNHVFTVTAYDSAGAEGNVLSTNTTGTVYVKPTGTTTTVSIVLEGVVQYVILTLATPYPPVGKAAAIGLTATLEDADKNLIVGPAPYEYPVTLTTTDPSKGPLSKTVLKSPADATGITVNYNGAKVASITYSATASGLPAADIANAYLAPGTTITQYPIPGGPPQGITAGPDGALWFTVLSNSPFPLEVKIGRITTGATISEYPDTSCANLYRSVSCLYQTVQDTEFAITAGPDGALWFTEQFGFIGRITTSGSLTVYSLPYSASFENGIAAGPDGALWFTEPGNPDNVSSGLVGKIGRFTTGGSYTEYPIPTTQGWPFDITVGPDGALWFTEFVGKIGRITTGGSITEYPIPSGVSTPLGIATGPDGALWFADLAGKIGRITTSGSITEYAVPAASSSPAYITAGPDGALWFTDGGANTIGRITTAGTITEYPIPTSDGAGPWGIVAGQDGALWFTEFVAGNIGRLAPAGLH